MATIRKTPEKISDTCAATLFNGKDYTEAECAEVIKGGIEEFLECLKPFLQHKSYCMKAHYPNGLRSCSCALDEITKTKI